MKWLPIVGYNDTYEISSDGQVRRTKRTHSAPAGSCLAQSLLAGYPAVCLDNKRILVHHLVARAFIGDRAVGHSGCQVNHKDGVKTHNHFTNLEYVTPQENAIHAVRLGLRRPMNGESNGQAKLTESKVRAIKEASGTHARIAGLYGISRTTVSLIREGLRWGHLFEASV
jgi:hypothetical protein